MNSRQTFLFDEPDEPWKDDEERDFLVANVAFPEAPFGPYDYRIPETLRTSLQVGMRVNVPLGRGNRAIVGYCVSIQNYSSLNPCPPVGRLKLVRSRIDTEPLISEHLLKLAQWLSDKYLTPLGQTIETIVPAGVRLQAGTREMVLLSVPTQVLAKLTQLKLPPKQLHVLKVLAASPEPLPATTLAERAGCTVAPIQQLRKKGLIAEAKQRVETQSHALAKEIEYEAKELNDDQTKALQRIRESLDSGQHQTILIRGITGSGKTEVYIQAIERVVQFKRQAIVLVPEISLTPQTRQRFRARFERVAVLHSHLSAAERHWHWQRIARGEVDVVVGARSAVFAPTPNLGLIIIDEEHDSSFKQDKAPRYHAREAARARASMLRIPLLLGSATPSLEAWHAARMRDYELVEMPNRVMNLPLPEVQIVDLRDEFRSKAYRGMISRPLFEAMRETLGAGGQTILLLNRRGFATSIQCPACGNVVECPNCDIALTHHQDKHLAMCHYCDYQEPEPTKCPDCKFEGIRLAGFGTQKLEEEVISRFPSYPCLRMDSDTMDKHGSHEIALDRFRRGEVQILLGTQMIAKGLDFPNVTLVGVINADTALHFPDFRAAERSFGLVTQVAGRTGRGQQGGRVLVQTFSPDHPAIQFASRHDYVSFAASELENRRELRYPPWGSMARLVFRGDFEHSTLDSAQRAVQLLRSIVGSDNNDWRILGPAPAPIARLRGKHRFHVLIQGLLSQSPQRVLLELSSKLTVPPEVQWIMDVDPLDML